MNPNEYRLIERALWIQGVTIRLTPKFMVFRALGLTIGWLPREATMADLQAYLMELGAVGRIRWPP